MTELEAADLKPNDTIWRQTDIAVLHPPSNKEPNPERRYIPGVITATSATQFDVRWFDLPHRMLRYNFIDYRELETLHMRPEDGTKQHIKVSV